MGIKTGSGKGSPGKPKGVKAGSGSGAPKGRGQPRKPLRPSENPFPEKKIFRLGQYRILEERDDYVICTGFDPNAENPWTEITPSAFRKIKVAKPPALQRTLWDGGSFDFGDVTYTFEYSDSEPGVRTARWTDENGAEQEEEQRIDIPYTVDDVEEVLVAAEIRKSGAVDGLDVEDEDGARLSWIDLNVSGRHWKSPAADEDDEDDGGTTGAASGCNCNNCASGVTMPASSTVCCTSHPTWTMIDPWLGVERSLNWSTGNVWLTDAFDGDDCGNDAPNEYKWRLTVSATVGASVLELVLETDNSCDVVCLKYVDTHGFQCLCENEFRLGGWDNVSRDDLACIVCVKPGGGLSVDSGSHSITNLCVPSEEEWVPNAWAVVLQDFVGAGFGELISRPSGNEFGILTFSDGENCCDGLGTAEGEFFLSGMGAPETVDINQVYAVHVNGDVGFTRPLDAFANSSQRCDIADFLTYQQLEANVVGVHCGGEDITNAVELKLECDTAAQELAVSVRVGFPVWDGVWGQFFRLPLACYRDSISYVGMSTEDRICWFVQQHTLTRERDISAGLVGTVDACPFESASVPDTITVIPAGGGIGSCAGGLELPPPSADGSCAGCATSAAPTDEEGACCLGIECLDVSEADCTTLGGEWFATDQECIDACQSEEGACCIGASCLDIDEANCDTLNGVFYTTDQACLAACGVTPSSSPSASTSHSPSASPSASPSSSPSSSPSAADPTGACCCGLGICEDGVTEDDCLNGIDPCNTGSSMGVAWHEDTLCSENPCGP